MELTPYLLSIFGVTILVILVAWLIYPQRKRHLHAARDKGCECRAGRLVVWTKSDCPVHGTNDSSTPEVTSPEKDETALADPPTKPPAS